MVIISRNLLGCVIIIVLVRRIALTELNGYFWLRVYTEQVEYCV